MKSRNSIEDLLRANVGPQETRASLAATITHHDIDNLTNTLTAQGAASPQGGARLAQHQRVPRGAGHQLLNLPQAPGAGQDAAGDGAVAANHPHQQGGAQGVANAGAADLRAVELLIRRIDAVTLEDEAAKNEPPRAYIGASSIGDPCEAYLALSLRGFYNDAPSAQLARIFDEGHRLEPVVVAALRRAGVKLRELDPATGKQYHFHMLGGHLAANLDGMVWKQRDPEKEEPTHTLEVKSMNRKMFESFVKKGVAVSHPGYFDQVQLGLGLSGLRCCLFVAYCKDNAKYHAEFVHFDEARFNALVAKAAGAMFAKEAKRTESWDCNDCFKRTACKVGMPPVDEERHCRHCRHSSPNVAVEGKKWLCNLHGHTDASVPCSDFSAYRVITITKEKK